MIAVNTALEVDIYGHVNSTHVIGSQLMNDIGGSGDFLRNSALSSIVTPSTVRCGAISAIVPMVTLVDHNKHSVNVIVTKHDLVATRPLTLRQVTNQMIATCAHPVYRDLLCDYYDREVRTVGDHELHLLGEAVWLHKRYIASGDMRATP
ncbi:MAG: acetyl-CoA hydrolase/transferase C-terminal domain-containing protein [Desulfobulbus sp.]|nr:acetyl-CoA hydrolase/transferase C-terminal domain-containing protein [Desulfobulbus sp.]